MPNIHDMVPSTAKFLKKEDIPQPRLVTIHQVTAENVALENQPPEIKGILSFHEAGLKPMVLNVTNQNVLEALYGPMTENWINKQIVIYNDPTIQMSGKIVGGLRLRPNQQPVQQTGYVAPEEPPMPDEIPNW